MRIVPKEQIIYVSKDLEFEYKTLYYETDKPRPFDIFWSSFSKGHLYKLLAKKKRLSYKAWTNEIIIF